MPCYGWALRQKTARRRRVYFARDIGADHRPACSRSLLDASMASCSLAQRRFMRTLTQAVVVTVVLLVVPLRAQPTELPLDLNFDTATFFYAENQTLVEVYLAIGAASLSFEANEDGFTDEVEIHLALRPAAMAAPDAATTAAVFADTLNLQFQVADTTGLAQGQYFLQQVRTAVAPGEYVLDVNVPTTADDGQGTMSLRRDLLVPDYAPDGRARLADLTLASSITRAADNADPRFIKNRLDIRPSPSRLFGIGSERVFYYTEAYGLNDAVAGGEYTLLARVTEANLTQPIEGMERRTSRAVRSPDVLVGAFDISALPSGSYFLRLVLLNADNEALAEQSQKFFVYNPNVVREDLVEDPLAEDYMTTLYASMPADELEENIKHALVIATSRERSRLNDLPNEEAKREYLAEFWRIRDPNSSTAINEARRDFYDRLLQIEERYSTNFGEAYETDQGRVMLKYGIPSVIDPRRSNSELRPHEVWEYENLPGEGRSIFVFADLDGFGTFELIHSDVTGEESRPDWRAALRR